MKKIILLFALITLFINTAYAQNAAQADQKYDMNFQNVTMKEFISFVAAFTNTNIVYNEADLRGNVSITSHYPIGVSSIKEIFNATLKSNGLNAVQEGGYVRVVPDKDIQDYPDPYYNSSTDLPDDTLATTVLMLNNYNAIALAAPLTRIKSKLGYVEALRGGVNGLLIRDSGARIEKMKEIVDALDRYGSTFHLYSVTLENIAASRMEQYVVKFYTELSRNFFTGQLPVTIADDVSNVFIYVADAPMAQKIQYLIAQIDVQNLQSSTLPRVYYLNYANAEDVEKVLNKLFVAGQPNQANTAAGAVKSNVSFDKSTNSIIAVGTQELYSNVESMIEKLDIPRRQVYVEALILETSMDSTDSYGVEWFGGDDSSSDRLGIIGSTNAGNLAGVMGSVAAGTSPVATLPGGFSAGIIGDVITFNGISFASLGAFMSALKSDSNVNIVSNPQILTLDNEEAEVFVGENRPYMTSEKLDANNNPIQSFDYRDVGIRLKVTPHISGEELISLDIEQEVNKLSPSSVAGSMAPITLTRQTKTKVQLYDKSIMLISGLMKDDTSYVEAGIPVLRAIPVLGWLFKSQETISEKTNMMVFISTQIIDTRADMEELTDERKGAHSMFYQGADDWSERNSIIPMEQKIFGGIGTEAE